MGMFDQKLTVSRDEKMRLMKLEDGGRVAVIGGGPAGSFFSYFFLDLPSGRVWTCNWIFTNRAILPPLDRQAATCAADHFRIARPASRRRRHSPPADSGRTRHRFLRSPHAGRQRPHRYAAARKKDCAVHRGAGPRGLKETKWGSFDGYLLETGQSKGARVIRSRAEDVDSKDGRIQVRGRDGAQQTYDLLTVATGINSASLKLVEKVAPGYAIPKALKHTLANSCLARMSSKNKWAIPCTFSCSTCRGWSLLR